MYPLVKMHGGKWFLKKWIISNFPKNYENMIYVEPFIGGGSVLLNKKKSQKEVINDIDSSLINIYNMLITRTEALINQLQSYEYSEETFRSALSNKDKFMDDKLDEACNEYIIKHMSKGGIGKKYAWSNRLRGSKPGDENAWESSISALYNIYLRIEDITILNLDFKSILRMYDDSNAFIYLDPPYLLSTRKAKEVYDNELSDSDHIKLLEIINKSKAMILLSGYNSLLYKNHLRGWNKYEKIVPNHSGQTKIKETRTEVLWGNY